MSGQRRAVAEQFEVDVLQNSLVFFEFEVLFPINVGETPLLGNDNFLAARELVASTTEGLLNYMGIGVLTTDGQQDLTNVDPSDGSVRFSPSTSHSGLQPSKGYERVRIRESRAERADQHQRKTTSC